MLSRTLPATVHAPQVPTTHAEQNINYQLHSAEISTILSQNLRIFLPELVPNNVTVQGNNFSPSPCHFNFLFFCFLWQFYFLGRDFINLKIVDALANMSVCESPLKSYEKQLYNRNNHQPYSML